MNKATWFTKKLRIRYEGEFGAYNSFGHVAREFALALISEPNSEVQSQTNS